MTQLLPQRSVFAFATAMVAALVACRDNPPPAPKPARLGTVASPATIDTFPADGPISPFGYPNTATYGQTFTPATGTTLRSFTLAVELPTTVNFRAYLYAWDGEKATGPELWQSTTVAPPSGGIELIQFTLPNVPLTGGQTYVFFTSTSQSVGSGLGNWRSRSDDPYPGGTFVFMNNGTSFGDLFTNTWSVFSSYDAAFTAVFGGADSTTRISSSVNPSRYGQPTTFHASVEATVSPLTSPIPQGNVVLSIDGSPVWATQRSLDATGAADIPLADLGAGNHTIAALYQGDPAGTYEASTSATMTQQVLKADTTTTLASSSNPSTPGTPVTLTASVAVVAPGAGTPTGDVNFREGTTILGTATVNAGVASITTNALGGGTHAIVAEYTGPSNFSASSGTLTQTVSTRGATLALSGAPTPAAYGSEVTLTATVTGDGTTPTGFVAFKEAGSTYITVALAGGVATARLSTLTGGSHVITADYTGDAQYAQATGTTTQVITPAATTTTLVSSPNPSNVGEEVTFTADVASTVPGVAGEVEFSDGATILGSVSTGTGRVAITTGALTAGKHSLKATFKGTSSYTGSASAVLEQTVKGPPAPETNPPADAGSRPTPPPSTTSDAGTPKVNTPAAPSTATDDDSGCQVTRVGRLGTPGSAGAALGLGLAVVLAARRSRRSRTS